MKKIVMILITLSMILALVACANDKGTSSSETVATTISAATEEIKLETSERTNIDGNIIADATLGGAQEDSSKVEITVDAGYANLQESTGFMFESNGDGTCTLTKIGDCIDKDIVIPEKSPAGDIITMIAEYAFYGAENIDSIIIAGRTMELDTKAFQECEAKKVVITGCNIIIGENAFSYCEDVTEVNISGSNIKVEEYAFYDAGKDMNVNIENCTGVLDEKAFQKCGITRLTINNSILELDENVFAYCEDLETVSFNDSTVEIGTYAFYDSGDEATIMFTNCGLEIDDKAFQQCGLITLNIVGSETTIGDNAFSYCEDLTDVIIGVGNTEIGTYSFYACTALVNVSVAADSDDDSLVLIINNKAFQNCAVQNVIIGRGNVKLGDNVFSYCEDLVSVNIKGTLSDIGDYVFYGCSTELAISYNGESYNGKSIEDVK